MHQHGLFDIQQRHDRIKQYATMLDQLNSIVDEENKQIKEGETPESWDSKPNKKRQKDTDARWTKKRNVSYFGYKNHVNVDAKHKFIRRLEVTSASVHDSQAVKSLLDKKNNGKEVYADSA